MGVAFSILVTIIIVGFLWFWIVRPILEDYNLIAPRESVNDYQEAHAPPAHVMSRQEALSVRPSETDARVSAVNPLWEEFLLDRTRARLITVMVDSGIPVAEIRGLLKGDNGAIGAEAEAARKRLGIEPPAQLAAPYVTPIAARPTSARFEFTDPDYPYQAPA